jgi:hypothetical protein
MTTTGLAGELADKHKNILGTALDCYGTVRVADAAGGGKKKFEANDGKHDHFHFDVSMREYTADYQARLRALNGSCDRRAMCEALGHDL